MKSQKTRIGIETGSTGNSLKEPRAVLGSEKLTPLTPHRSGVTFAGSSDKLSPLPSAKSMLSSSSDKHLLSPLGHTPKSLGHKSYSFEDNFGVANLKPSHSSRRWNAELAELDTSLPSLSTYVSRSSISLIGNDFSNSLPIFRRGRYEVFGGSDMASLDELSLNSQSLLDDASQSSLGEAKRFITRFGNASQTSTATSRASSRGASRGGSRNSKKRLLIRKAEKSAEKSVEKTANAYHGKRKDSYVVKSTVGHDLMKSDEDRSHSLEQAQLRKKDKEKSSDQFFKRKKSLAVKPKTPQKPAFGSRGGSLQVGDDEDFDEHLMGLTGGAAAVEGGAAPSAEQDELSKVFDQYFGLKSREDFNAKFKTAELDLERYEDEETLPPEKLTPRSLFLRETAKAGTMPLPLILRKESNPMGIYLGHKGLGDLRMMPVIKVLDKLPSIRSIDFCDNRLTDTTLMPLALKLQQMHQLTYLDLSFNKIDDSSATIMDYLRDEKCRLRTLLLNGADVDDHECANVAQALSNNKSLRTLGLNHNKIGDAELLNTLYPDLITGAEALGSMLRVNTTLTKLDLGWNSIRFDSAIALAESLAVNNTLRTLWLPYNSFGDMPSQVLGRVIKGNKGVTDLDIECNSITPKACTVLANAISFNETLLKLNINGNILGKIGAQALVAAIQRCSSESRKLQVSFVNCDCAQNDDHIFSAANPHGTWRLNLKEPYGQMVAAECLYLANYKAGCRIVKLMHNGNLITLERSFTSSGEDGESGQAKKFKLEEFYKNCRTAATELVNGTIENASRSLQVLMNQFDFRMQEEQRQNVLKKTLELWNAKAKREGRDDLQEVFLYEVFFALFVLGDTDMSGTMDLDEFLETLDALGKPNFDPEIAKRMMAEHDKDESGTIDANEFGMIMLNEFCQTELPKGDLVDASTGQPWVIPPSGACVIQLSYQCDVPTVFDIGQDYGIDNIIQSIRDAKTDDQREILFQNTTSSPYFFLSFDQAQLLFEEMQGLNRLPLDLMANILPQIVNEEQVNRFIETNLNDRGKLALRVKLGQLYCSYVGLHTGHYAIDLKQSDQRNGGRRLGAICVTEGKFCRSSGAMTSQKGNNSNFRNEKLGYTPVEVTGRWFASTTSTKVLRCDYVSTSKPHKGVPPMTQSRLERLIAQLELEDIRKAWTKIGDRQARAAELEAALLQYEAQSLASQSHQYSHHGHHSHHGSGQASSNASVGSHDLSNHSHHSHHGHHSHRDEDSLGPTGLNTPAHTARTSFLSPQPNRPALVPEYMQEFPDMGELLVEAPITPKFVQEHFVEYMETCYHYHDIYPEERMRDVSRPNYSATERPPTPEVMRNPPAPSKQVMHPIFPMAYRRVLELQIMMPNLFLSVAQLTQILEYFPPEGYLRIQLIQSVFSHIVDLENMYTIIDKVLNDDERLEIFHRIGIMNLLDPMRPDRFYRLDLRKHDQREWVKILVVLAIAEPGENWEHTEYRWGKYDEPVPGWSLPGTWTWEDDGGHNGGPRNHGWLRLYYRSQGNGCMPVMSVRKYLRKRTLAGMKKIL